MLTLPTATQHVDELVHQALGLLPPARVVKVASDPAPCDDPSDGGPVGRFTAVAEYQVFDLSVEDYPRYFQSLLDWWTANGFQVLKDARPRALYVWVEHPVDGFRMAAQANDAGGLYLTATSPCVWP